MESRAWQVINKQQLPLNLTHSKTSYQITINILAVYINPFLQCISRVFLSYPDEILPYSPTPETHWQLLTPRAQPQKKKKKGNVYLIQLDLLFGYAAT